jgi:ADP-heptose:LPS heptosyltransferase
MLLLAPFDFIARRGPHIRHSGKLRVLVVRVDAIGDFTLWLDSARSLRRLYPPNRYHITLVGNLLWAALARELPDFDEVWGIDRRSFALDPLYRYEILRRIALGGFSLALHPTFARDFLWGDALIRASGADSRIGFSGNIDLLTPLGSRISDRWYTALVETAKTPMMELQRNAQFMRALGLTSFRAGIPSLRTRTPLPRELRGRDFYVLCPGASHAPKRWPPENFAEIATRIFAHTGWLGVICGSHNEAALARHLRAATTVPLEDFTGRTTIGGLAAILAGSRFVLGNDTGMVTWRGWLVLTASASLAAASMGVSFRTKPKPMMGYTFRSPSYIPCLASDATGDAFIG